MPDGAAPRDWVTPFYTRKSEWLGPSGVLPHHRERVAAVERRCGSRPQRILELGAGSGGTAAALAGLGHTVVAIELSPLRAKYARDLTREPRLGSVTVIEGDFYTAQTPGPFNLVCYWDGFGVGADADQRRLLRRYGADWLRDDGLVLLDVYSPWAWVAKVGNQHRHDDIDCLQSSDFDYADCRFVDEWWPVANRT